MFIINVRRNKKTERLYTLSNERQAILYYRSVNIGNGYAKFLWSDVDGKRKLIASSYS